MGKEEVGRVEAKKEAMPIVWEVLEENMGGISNVGK